MEMVHTSHEAASVALSEADDHPLLKWLYKVVVRESDGQHGYINNIFPDYTRDGEGFQKVSVCLFDWKPGTNTKDRSAGGDIAEILQRDDNKVPKGSKHMPAFEFIEQFHPDAYLPREVREWRESFAEKMAADKALFEEREARRAAEVQKQIDAQNAPLVIAASLQKLVTVLSQPKAP